jgi:hypothetical protein
VFLACHPYAGRFLMTAGIFDSQQRQLPTTANTNYHVTTRTTKKIATREFTWGFTSPFLL